MARQPSTVPGPPHFRDCTITLRHAALSRSSLDECSDRRGDLYLTIHNTHRRQTHPCPPAGFQPAIPASKWPQTQALYRAALGSAKYTK